MRLYALLRLVENAFERFHEQHFPGFEMGVEAAMCQTD